MTTQFNNIGNIRIYPCYCGLPAHSLRVELLSEKDHPMYDEFSFSIVIAPSQMGLKDRIKMAIRLLFGETPFEWHEIRLAPNVILDMTDWLYSKANS